MEELETTTLKKIIRDNGVEETLLLLTAALNELSNEYSDLLLKEKSIEAAETADLLMDICDNCFEDCYDEDEDEDDESNEAGENILRPPVYPSMGEEWQLAVEDVGRMMDAVEEPKHAATTFKSNAVHRAYEPGKLPPIMKECGPRSAYKPGKLPRS